MSTSTIRHTDTEASRITADKGTLLACGWSVMTPTYSQLNQPFGEPAA